MNGVSGMFIFTTKFSKRKAILAVLILAALLVAVILVAGAFGKSTNTKEAAALSAVVKTNDQRVKYLNALGWEVETSPLEEQSVVIPREFSEVYQKYNDIQLAQGFDLSRFGGIEASRYTYNVLNYPNATGHVVADLLVYKNEVIAGDVQSNAFDGFMVGLRFPSAASAVSPKALQSNAPKASPTPVITTTKPQSLPSAAVITDNTGLNKPTPNAASTTPNSASAAPSSSGQTVKPNANASNVAATATKASGSNTADASATS